MSRRRTPRVTEPGRLMRQLRPDSAGHSAHAAALGAARAQQAARHQVPAVLL